MDPRKSYTVAALSAFVFGLSAGCSATSTSGSSGDDDWACTATPCLWEYRGHSYELLAEQVSEDHWIGRAGLVDGGIEVAEIDLTLAEDGGALTLSGQGWRRNDPNGEYDIPVTGGQVVVDGPSEDRFDLDVATMTFAAAWLATTDLAGPGEERLDPGASLRSDHWAEKPPDKVANGCSGPCPARYEPCCDDHDRCYHSGGPLGLGSDNRGTEDMHERCDTQFESCMHKVNEESGEDGRAARLWINFMLKMIGMGDGWGGFNAWKDRGEESPDRDADWVDNAYDNCPDKYNPDQEDADDDGIGDVCDDGDAEPDCAQEMMVVPGESGTYPGSLRGCDNDAESCGGEGGDVIYELTVPPDMNEVDVCVTSTDFLPVLHIATPNMLDACPDGTCGSTECMLCCISDGGDPPCDGSACSRWTGPPVEGITLWYVVDATCSDTCPCPDDSLDGDYDLTVTIF